MSIGHENYLLKNFKKALFFIQKGMNTNSQSVITLKRAYYLIGLIYRD